MKPLRTPFSTLLASTALFFGLATLALAAEPNAAGTWKWSFTIGNGDTLEPVLKLKQEGSKLTGTLEVRGNESKVEDGKISSEGQVTFKVTREREGQSFTTKYDGKLQGDVIKGKSESNFGGEVRSRDWEAKREKSGVSLAGDWTSTIILDDGQTFDMQLRLKQEGAKVTGTLAREGGTERALSETSLKENEFKFVVKSEREGRTVTSKYSGTINGDAIKGSLETDYTGENLKLQWEAKKQK